MAKIETNSSGVNFAKLYDNHEDYAARRVTGSLAHSQIVIETKEFKIPNLHALIPADFCVHDVLEIGCATGELIGNFPVPFNGRRAGNDISIENIRAARLRFPEVSFSAGDFRDNSDNFDCTILSDILEHVDDDAEFLAAAAARCRYVLVNLPLEDNWLNFGRTYGPDDVSGHLRKYSLSQGLDLFRRAGLEVVNYRQVWAHEQSFDTKRRALRKQFNGQDYAGSALKRFLKHLVVETARAMPPVGRRLFASNLFAIARRPAS
ncbi:MAG: methyltransferase domain-containing protein [Hyphomicrobiaceae bacterium]